MPCCPIEVGKFEDSESIPYDAANEGEQSGKAMGPPALEGDETQQYVKKQSGPELPADGVFGMPQKIANFEGLFD